MDQNEALLQAVVRGSEMGKNSLDQLLPMAQDPQLRAEMLRQQREYRLLNQRAHTALAALGEEAEGIEPMEKWGARMGIAGRTLLDRSPEHLARLLIQGSTMGQSDCIGAKNDCPEASDGAKQMADDLCRLEEEGAQKLRAFL